MVFLEISYLVILLPLVAFLLVGLLGRWIPGERGGWATVFLVGVSSFLALGIFGEVLSGASSYESPYLQKGEWWRVGSYVLNATIYIDPLTAVMLFVVGILVFLIVLYSIGYMGEEGESRSRYFAEIALFIVGMLGLVLSGNYLMLFLFWEIMGLCSYLLIGYWYRKPSAARAAVKAFLVTRVGDAFLLLGIAILFVSFGKEGIHSLDFDFLFHRGFAPEERPILALANLLIFLGAVGKSAQFPLHVWLPDAMEGPTTISALIHAATMVKAGVYLVGRSYPLFLETPEVLVLVAVVGAFTALFAATMAVVGNDLKRVLAYSTLSQLGYMFLGLGVAGIVQGEEGGALRAVALGGLTVAFFHLTSHAFFKAGLFLSAGSVGHARHQEKNPYDIREMGGIRKAMPITALAMLLATLSIAGIPPLSGFYSKDALLEAVFEAGEAHPLYFVLYAVGLLTAFLTAYYMVRVYLVVFEGSYRGTSWKDLREGNVAHAPHPHLHEAPWTMRIPLLLLAFFSVASSPLLLAFSGGNLSHLLRAPTAPLEGTSSLGEALLGPFLHPLTWASVGAALAGGALAFARFRPSRVLSNLRDESELTGFSKVLSRRYYIDDLYGALWERGVKGWAQIEGWVDERVVDGVVNGIGERTRRIGQRMRFLQTGDVQDYASAVVVGAVLLILIVLYSPYLPLSWPFGG